MSERPGSPIADDLRRISSVIGITLVIVAIAVIAYAFARDNASAPASRIIGIAVLILAAFATAGAILGFVFAIPRSRQQDVVLREGAEGGKSDLSASPDPSSGRPHGKQSDYAANTNLEQISDWLTKILVGAGLVQLDSLSQWVARLATTLAAALGNAETERPFVLCLMGIGVGGGFLFSYMVVRLWLPRALTRAEGEEELQKLGTAREAERQRLALWLGAELGDLERRAYAYLYEPPPGGFSRAIEEIEAYLKRPDAIQSGWLYLYLACAYGQRHAHEKPSESSDQDKELREKVREAVAKAIQLNASTKTVLQRVYEGTVPWENDLRSLKGDEELEVLLK